MMSYLLHVTLGAPSDALVERIVKTAALFLETKAAVEPKVLGVYERTSRSAKRTETLYVVSLTFESETGIHPSDAGLGRKLEGILRSTVAESGAEAGEVKVYATTARSRRHEESTSDPGTTP